jgi:hypothetical protein
MLRAHVAWHGWRAVSLRLQSGPPWSDLVEGHVEHVVQNEGQSLGWGQRVEHDLQREADRVGHEHLVLRVERAGAPDDWIRQMYAGGLFGARLPRLQCVQTYACHDGREPPAEVFDPICSRAADAQPGILNSFIGFGDRAQHPIGHRPEMRAMCLEVFDKPVRFVHARSWFSPSL